MAKPQKMGHKAKQEQKIARCKEGHPIQRALLAPVFGRKRLIWVCECTLTPMANK